MDVARRHPLVAFLALAGAVVLASRTAVAAPAFGRRPDALAFAVAFDLTVTLSAAAWLTLVRSGAFSRATVAVVFVAGASLAAAILPPGHRTWAHRVALLAGPVEAALLAFVAVRVRRVVAAARRFGRTAPPEDALAGALREALGAPRLAEAIAAEGTALLFALGSWRAAPLVPSGAIAFSAHRKIGMGAVVAALSLASVGEILAVHLLLALWSARAAWVATALSAYSLLWLVGDARAVALRPALLFGDRLVVRTGIRWRATVPLAAIDRICEGSSRRGHEGARSLSPLGPPRLWLHLSGPIEVEGLLGIRRRTACIGLRVDDSAALAAELRARCPGAAAG